MFYGCGGGGASGHIDGDGDKIVAAIFKSQQLHLLKMH